MHEPVLIEEKKRSEEFEKFLNLLKFFFILFSFFSLSCSISLLNKSVFHFTNFQYPVFLSCVHMLTCALFSNFLFLFTNFIPEEKKNLSPEAVYALRKFVFLFCFNIAFGNISVRIVNLALNQILRSTIPLATIVFSYLILKRKTTWYIIVSLIPVIVGVSLLTTSDTLVFSFSNFVVIVIGILLSAFKTTITNLTLVEHKIHPMVLLSYLTPYAIFVMFFIGVIFGEAFEFYQNYKKINFFDILLVLLTGLNAFFLNITNFLSNRASSPLTLSVIGNIKQVATLFLSILIFQTKINYTGYLGIIVAFLGLFIYTFAKFYHKNQINKIETLENVTDELHQKDIGEILSEK